MTYCILLAGGVGQRVGADRPKQFVEVLGRPVIAYTLDIFEAHKEVDGILIVCHPTWRTRMDCIVAANKYKKVFKIVDGGEDFQHSMMNGVGGLEGIAKDDDVIITHWAASPFVTDDIISDGIKVCREHGNSMSACPFYLIVGSNDGGHSSKWVDRDSIVQLNAPQTFLYSYIRDFYKKAVDEKMLDKVEPHTTTLMYKMGYKIFFSKGSQANIKITTKEDLFLLEGFLLARKLRKQKP